MMYLNQYMYTTTAIDKHPSLLYIRTQEPLPPFDPPISLNRPFPTVYQTVHPIKASTSLIYYFFFVVSSFVTQATAATYNGGEPSSLVRRSCTHARYSDLCLRTLDSAKTLPTSPRPLSPSPSPTKPSPTSLAYEAAAARRRRGRWRTAWRSCWSRWSSSGRRSRSS